MTAIYVNEVPTKPENCPFARAEIDGYFRDRKTDELIPVYIYYCNISNERCELFSSIRCSKLLKPFLGY